MSDVSISSRRPKKAKPAPGIIRRFEDGRVQYRHTSGAIENAHMFPCVTCGREQLHSRLMPITSTLWLNKLCFTCFEQENAERSAAFEEERILQEALFRGYTQTYLEGETLPGGKKRRVAMALASVMWRDRVKIAAIYQQAKNVSRHTGIVHHVDHIYPLQGAFGCGLHVHQNLRVIEGTENLSKNNLFPLHDSPALK